MTRPNGGALRAWWPRTAALVLAGVIAHLPSAARGEQHCADQEAVDAPGAVDGSRIYFDAIGPNSVTLHWHAPCLGKYGAAILGYSIEYKQVCVSAAPRVESVSPPVVHVEPTVEGAEIALTQIPGTDVITAAAGKLTAFSAGSIVRVMQKSGQASPCASAGTYTVKSTSATSLTLVSAIGKAGTASTCALKQQLSGLSSAQALGMRAASVTGVGSRTATVKSTGTGLSAYAYASSSWAKFDRADAVDTVTGVSLTDCPGAAWTDLPAVYTPTKGQNHEGECQEVCRRSACSAIGDTSSAGHAHIIDTCSGCFASEASKTGCFPGADGFPTEPLTRHTARGLIKDNRYVFRVRAYNAFGTSVDGSPSYAVHTHGPPTAPVNVRVASGQLSLGSDHSRLVATSSGSEVSIEWSPPENWGVGTDDCVPTASKPVPVTRFELQCSARSPLSVVRLCGGKSDATMSQAEFDACLAEQLIPTPGCKPILTNSALGSQAANVAIACAALSEDDCNGTDVGLGTSSANDCVYFAGCGFDGSQIIPETCTTVGRAVNSPIVAYTVEYSPGDSHVVSKGTSFKATGLKFNTQYTFTVRATTAAGEGAKSEPLILWTPDVPAKPTAPIVAISAKANEITLIYKIAQESVVAQTSGSSLTSYKLYAQSEEKLASCNPIDADASVQVFAACAVLTCTGASPCAACTDVDVGLGTTSDADCQWTKAWLPAARDITNDGEAESPSSNISYTSRGKSSRSVNQANPAWPWLEIERSTTGIGDGTVTVTNLMPSTAYRFKVAFMNSGGSSPASDPSATFSTLEQEITDLRIYSGPPCVYKHPSSATTTFAASAAGTNVKYRWELSYRQGSGWAAIDAHNSGGGASTIAGPGPSGFNNCLTDDCSVMEYLLPLPGSDHAAANYDEIEIRAVAYNNRGIVMESVSFGWTSTGDHDYQTVEYCGCTDPSDDNYWDIASYHVPTECAGLEDWEASAEYYELGTVLSGEFDYYQMPVDDSTYDVQVSVRVDAGAVDIFLSASGVADPELDSTHIKSLQKVGVTGFAVVNIDYTDFANAKSVYITVRGSTGVTDTRACPEATCKSHMFGRYKLLAQATNFRSFTCDKSDNKVGIDCSDSSKPKVSRVLLSHQVAQQRIVPSHYYHFYELYYPESDNDLDVEVKVTVNTEFTPLGAVTVYASKSERFPGPQRATSDPPYAGYWTQPNHITNAHSGTATANTNLTLVFTMQPHDHTNPTPNLLYLSVFGAAAHAQGTQLTHNAYAIVSKIYRYRVESDLLQPVGGVSGELTEERRYSVVTQDNFNYYEVPIKANTKSLHVSITLHYGSVTLYRSKYKLPTQDLAEGADWRYDIATPSTSPHKFSVDSSGLNMAGGFLYLGLIGRAADSSYSIKVTFSEFIAHTELFYCPELMPATNVGLDETCTTTITEVQPSSFYRFYVGTRDEDKSVMSRDRSGSKPQNATSLDKSDTWGMDWTDTPVVSWSDSFSDEWDLDVDVTTAIRSSVSSSAFQIFASSTETYPSAERAYCVNGRFATNADDCAAQGSQWSVTAGATNNSVSHRTNTHTNAWVYIGIFADGVLSGSCGAKYADHISACEAITSKLQCDLNQTTCRWSALHISFEDGEAKPAATSSNSTHAVPTCKSDCSNRGACIIDGKVSYCICSTGYYGTSCASSVSDDMAETSITATIPGCSFVAGAKSCVVPERPAASAALENVPLNCNTDDCSPRGESGRAGHVYCDVDGVTCYRQVAAPIVAIEIKVTAPPPYSRVRAYIDSRPYPRPGANTFTVGKAPSENPAGTVTKELKVYSLVAQVVHTLVLVLTAYSGEPIATVQRQFAVSYVGGCEENAAGEQCTGNGICHDGYCVCFDGHYGTDCANTIADTTAPSLSLADGFLGVDGTGMQSFRTRRERLALDKVGEARFVHSQRQTETAAGIERSNSALTAIKAEVSHQLQAGVTGADSILSTKLRERKAATAESVDLIRAKAERNTILLQQSKQEATRLRTANLEAYLDHKRSLFNHQTAVQNRHAADKVASGELFAERSSQIDTAFQKGRFIKGQLRNANGPRTLIKDLKTEQCSSDQFFRTECKAKDASFVERPENHLYGDVPR